jgi:predicted metal-dependent HD superfamily phosphohydrolase
MLIERWLTALPDPAAPGARTAGQDLLDRWSQPHRRYHTVGHLGAVLDVVDGHAGHAADPDAVRLAAWFHDAVYEPAGTGNEEASADLAARVLPGLGLPAARVAEVVRLVRLTTGHDPAPGDRDGELLCDADLSVLAGDPAAYAAYALAVRHEYGFVPDEAFRAGRAAVLRHLLALPRLYRVPELAAAWEPAARANLAAELATLEA